MQSHFLLIYRSTIMAKKEAYKLANEEFLQKIAAEEGICSLPKGMYYKKIESGTGTVNPGPNSIVSVNYKGSLINGREFDNNWNQGFPDAFRLKELIVGWQIALRQMVAGDHWIIYIPCEVGYGTRTSGPIPACSTLIFEIKLVNVA